MIRKILQLLYGHRVGVDILFWAGQTTIITQAEVHLAIIQSLVVHKTINGYYMGEDSLKLGQQYVEVM